MIGSISVSTWRTRGSWQSIPRQLEAEAQPAQHRQAHDELHDRAGEHADRVGVELVGPVEARLRARRAAPMITKFQTSGASAGIVNWS